MRVADEQQQYLVLAAICTVISVLSLYWCVFGVRDRVLAFEAKRIQVEESASIQTQYKSGAHDISLSTQKLGSMKERLQTSLRETKSLDPEKLRPFVEKAKTHALEQHQAS